MNLNFHVLVLFQTMRFLRMAFIFTLIPVSVATGQTVSPVDPTPAATSASPTAAFLPEMCLSSGKPKRGVDMILVPATDSKTYEALGYAKVACGKLDRQLYRDRVCRAARSVDELGSFTQFGRTTAELSVLCEAASKVLGPHVHNSSPTRPEGAR